MLGDAQLGRHDNEINNNDTKTLHEAEKSFRASLELEGKPGGGKEVPVLIQEQQWWKEKQAAKTKQESTTTKAANTTKGNQRISPTKSTTLASRGRGKKMIFQYWVRVMNQGQETLLCWGFFFFGGGGGRGFGGAVVTTTAFHLSLSGLFDFSHVKMSMSTPCRKSWVFFARAFQSPPGEGWRVR